MPIRKATQPLSVLLTLGRRREKASWYVNCHGQLEQDLFNIQVDCLCLEISVIFIQAYREYTY
jgi:hypothetical protein